MQVVEEGLARRGEAVAALLPIVVRSLADVQERLTFRTQAFIKVHPGPLLPPHNLGHLGNCSSCSLCKAL